MTWTQAREEGEPPVCQGQLDNFLWFLPLFKSCTLSLLSKQLLLMLEGLVAERNRLNEALQAERQLYGSLVKFHTQPDR